MLILGGLISKGEVVDQTPIIDDAEGDCFTCGYGELGRFEGEAVECGDLDGAGGFGWVGR